MATTKESMKVIAGGLDKKEEPEVVMEGKVIAVEVPDELAEAFERLIGGMITKCEDNRKARNSGEILGHTAPGSLHHSRRNRRTVQFQG